MLITLCACTSNQTHVFVLPRISEEQLQSRLRRQRPVSVLRAGLERNLPEPAPTLPGTGPYTTACARGDLKERKASERFHRATWDGQHTGRCT
jgi:hypothetical protein